MKRFKCKICGKRFDNLLFHLYKGNKKTLKKEYGIYNHPSVFIDANDIKPDHLKKFKRIKKSVRTKKNMRCLCGGYIYTSSWTDEYGSFVEILCEKCEFMWDEYYQG